MDGAPAFPSSNRTSDLPLWRHSSRTAQRKSTSSAAAAPRSPGCCGERSIRSLCCFTTDNGNVYRDSPLARLLNRAIGVAIKSFVAASPPDRRIRVLEIGAGTGGTTESILPFLPPDRTSYCYTDISPTLVAAARQRFAAYPFVDFRVLDIERDPSGAQFGAGFDLIIAANVVHATADVGESLDHLRAWLAPRGILLLQETVRQRRWLDIVFGLTEGWWRFADSARRDGSPLLSTAAWLDLLAECGFRSACAVDDDPNAEQAIIVAAADAGGPWLIAADPGGAAAMLATRLASEGVDCVVSPHGSDPAARLGERPWHGILDCRALGSADAAGRCGDTLALLQAAIRHGRTRLWLATVGAQPATASGAEPDAATIWGLSRVAALEHPELDCRCIDLDPEASPDQLASALASEMFAANGEREIAWRGNCRRVPRLVRAPPPRAASPAIAADGWHLITGGFGGLGLRLATWLVEQGARSIALVGHHPPSEPAAAAITALESGGCTVEVLQADIASRLAVERILEELDARGTPLKAVYHLAGTLDDGAVLQQDRSRFARVFAAKVEGARHLDQLTRTRALDAFVLFSTSAALFGYSGQANHAAANAWLDALAHHRRAFGLPALSLNWGAWNTVGAAVERKVSRQMQNQGVRLITPERGLAALGRAMTADTPQLAVIPIVWREFLAGQADHVLPLFAGFAQTAGEPGKVAAAPASARWRELIARLPPEQQPEQLATLVAGAARSILAYDADRPIDPAQPLNELGLDSLMALELRKRIAAGLERPLPATLLFNYPTLAALTGFLADGLIVSEVTPTASASAMQAETAQLLEVAALSDADMAALIDKELANLLDEE